MLKQFLEMALRGIISDLEANPRGISIRVCLRDRRGKWHRKEVARISASSVREVLTQDAEARLLEIELGQGTLFRVSLGSRS